MEVEAKSSIIQYKRCSLCPLDDNRTIIRAEFRPNCFLYQSFGYEQSTFGDYTIRPNVTFLADSGKGTAAEWEPQYGPIQIRRQCDADWTEVRELGGKLVARRHWHFPYIQGDGLAWSQTAVDREGLKEKLAAGDFDAMFDVLERWADRD